MKTSKQPKFLVIDVETTTKNNGHPFDPTNRLCSIGLRSADVRTVLPIEYSTNPYGNALQATQSAIDDCDVVVAFSAKFDLHWLSRYGIKYDHKPLWDLQYVEFILSGQTRPMLSLGDCLEMHGLGQKQDYIAETYWKKGIDTPNIPWDELEAYNYSDIDNEYALLLHQLDRIQQGDLRLKRTIWDGCQDILITAEMERNGIFYNTELSERIAGEKQDTIDKIDNQLASLFPDLTGKVNWNSGEHISAVLFGGSLPFKYRLRYVRQLKSGKEVEHERWETGSVTLPRLVAPLPKTELAKAGFFSTSADVLKSVNAKGIAKKTINLLLERAKLEKAIGTYFRGIPEKMKEFGWENSLIHGQLNHCKTATSRLASMKPNLQNMDAEVRLCIQSRYS